MKEKPKRVIALMLALAISMSLLSVNAWADELVPASESVVTLAEEFGEVGEDYAETQEIVESNEIEIEEAYIEPQFVVDSGTCGTNLTWTLDDAGTLTIRGSGAMKNWAKGSYAPWYSNRWSIQTVIISSGVTSIGEYAFDHCTSLMSISIPNSIVSIGDHSFHSCDSLTSISIPNSVKAIGDYAFGWCEDLTSIKIPNSVSSIGNYVFAYCYSLASISIPNSVTSIGDYAFSRCYSLTSISIPNSVKNISNWMFEYCWGLTSISIPNGVTSIGDGAFYDCGSLTSINIPNSITSIGDYVFHCCSGLTSISIPNSVKTIGNYAFWECDNLTSLNVPSSVTFIGSGTFEDCEKLTSISIPNSVTSIGEWAFYRCTSLTSISIPNSVTSIQKWAFYDCDDLTDVYYGGSKEQWKRISIFSYNSALTNATIHYNNNTGKLFGMVVSGIDDEKYGSHNDVALMYNRLTKNQLSSYQVDNNNIHTFSYDSDNRPITIETMNKWIDYSFSSTTDNDISLFYYSGHSTWDGNSATNYGISIGQNAACYRWGALTKKLASSIKGKIIIIIDACFASNFQTVGINELSAADKERFTIITSCGTSQKSMPRNACLFHELYYGRFTYYLGEGIGFFDNKLNADTNKDGKITVNEICSYTSKKVAADKGNKEFPMDVGSYSHEPDLVLFEYHPEPKANSITATTSYSKTYSTKAQTITLNAKCKGGAKLTYKANDSKIKLSGGKVTIPAKYIGKFNVTVTAAATSNYKKATKNIIITVAPTKTTLSSVKNVKGKKMTVKWKKNTVGSGYQVQYSTDKSFKTSVKTVTIKKNKTTSTTISKLTKGKNYFVRIRSYKTGSKVKYYSSWSSVKNVKINK